MYINVLGSTPKFCWPVMEMGSEADEAERSARRVAMYMYIYIYIERERDR